MISIRIFSQNAHAGTEFELLNEPEKPKLMLGVKQTDRHRVHWKTYQIFKVKWAELIYCLTTSHLFHEEQKTPVIQSRVSRCEMLIYLFNGNIFSKWKEMQWKVSQQKNFFTAALRNVNTFHWPDKSLLSNISKLTVTCQMSALRKIFLR